MAESAHSTATLRLTMGNLRIAHPITVPNAATSFSQSAPCAADPHRISFAHAEAFCAAQ